MNWTIETYEKDNGEKPVDEFLKELPPKHKAKAIWEIDLLKEFGTNLKEPYTKSIQGKEYKDLWELRIKFASDISRIFYFLFSGDTFILLHGFIKKTNSIPKKELEIAKRRMKDYKRRFENE